MDLLTSFPYLLQAFGGTQGLEGTWTDLGWNGIALLAVMICFFFFTLVYILARSLSMESLKRWAASELLQVVASSILIILLVNLVNYGTVIAINVILQGGSAECGGANYAFELNQFGVPRGNPIDFAQCRMQEKITGLEQDYRNIFNSNLKVEKIAQTCYSVLGIQIYCGDWYYHGEVERAHLLASKITPLLANLHGQYSILSYIEQNMLAVFLPLGIILRVLPFTRGAGGLLIAVALGLYFLLPAFYVLTDYSFVAGDVSAVSVPESRVFNSCYPGFSGSSALLDEVVSEMPQIVGTYDQMGSKLAQLTVGIMFYPFIALSLSLVFIRFLAPLFGGDLGELSSMVSKVI